MSRLRYVGLAGSIGSSGLTNSATAHTFNAPLTYANGTVVPTLTGSDFFMLSIFDATGALTEIIQVSAYNSSTGVATLARGQEGMTAVAHTWGDRVALGFYPTDFPTTTTTPAVVPALRTTQSGLGTATVTVPAGVVTTDYVLVSESNTALAPVPSGSGWTTAAAATQATGFYGCGVNVFYKSGLQAGDTFTVTSGGSYQISYWTGVTSVAGGAVGNVGNTGSNVGVITSAISPHQMLLVVGGFTTSSAVVPFINIGVSAVGNVSGNLGGFFAAGAQYYSAISGSTITSSAAVSNWNGVLAAIVLIGTPATGTLSQMAETPASAVSTPTAGTQMLFIDSTDHRYKRKDSSGIVKAIDAHEAIMLAVTDESTTLTTGTKITFRMPFALTVTEVRASLTTASSSGIPAINVKEAGVSIFSTTLTIDATEKTSTTAATPAVISDPSLADDAEITVSVDAAGTGATGLKVTLVGYRS